MSSQAPLIFEPLALVGLIREIAEASGVPEPRSISQRAWDSARERANVSSPPARSIAARLHLPWPKLREIAFMVEPGRSIALGLAIGEKAQDWLAPEYISFALNLAARRRGKQTVNPGEYEHERALLLGQDRSHWLHGGRLKLPTKNQIEVASGGWNPALRAAGLEDSKSPEYGRQEVVPSIPDILERCYEAHGSQATRPECETFARANGIPFPVPKKGWGSYVSEWKEQRRERDLAIPDGPPPRSERPDYSLDLGASREGERRRKTSWNNLDEALDWVTRYLAQLEPGETASQRSYGLWAATQEGAIYPSAIRRNHGGWVKVREAAWERLKTGV
jgi:hypothetical protein